MANIKNELNQIKNAVYGREVRGSIHDGIKKINDEVEDSTTTSNQAKHQVENIQEQVDNLVVSGDSSVEAAQARVDKDNHNYATLKERLDTEQESFTTQLAETDSLLHFTQRGVSSVSPSFVIVDDDTKSEAYTILKPILDQKGIKGTFAAITGKIGESGYLTESQLMNLHNEGHDIISHTVTHADLTTLSDSAVDADLKDSKQYLNSLGIEAKHIMYPFGRNNAKVRRYTKRYYESAGTTTNYERVNKRPLKTYQVGRLGIGVYGAELEQELESFIPYIEDAIENNLMCVFMTHIGETPTNKIHVIEDIIDYVHSKGYGFETYSEAYEKHRNTLDYGDGEFAIGAMGEVDIPSLSVYTATHDEYTNGNSPNDFKERTLTINVVRDNSAGGLPENRGGVLETYRLSGDDLFTFQRFRVRNTKNVYSRSSTAAGVWEDWDIQSDYQRLTPNSVNGNSPNTDFPDKKGSFVFIQDNNASGLPEEIGGLLFTYIGTSNRDYTYQEFVPRKTSRKYIRYWDSNKWSKWAIVGGVAVFGYEAFDINSDMSEFAVGESRTMIRDANANGFPENKGGTFITYKMPDDDFSYQEYKLAKSTRKFIRSYINGSFVPFKEITIE